LSLSAGTKLGPYEVVAQIGAGGMGEVYKARDTRLERTVAVKVLPKHLSSSPEVRQRFEREAKTVSQLSHPHICALYDVGREGETEYLVMEYLEGDTLSDRLGRGALPLEQTLKFGVEIADALDKAHRQGIVHRDLKPGNVMLTKSGVKLLDFGLAKAMAAPVQTSEATSLPTVMGSGGNLTQEGTILGTFQYMAPEQLEGREADARTDVFAFGCVLYEMATGKKAFSGASQASLISAIMKEEPAPISAVQPMTPPALDRVVRTCLAKDPEDRWQSASDLRNELKWIAAGGSQSGVAAPAVAPGRHRAWLPWAAALVLAAAGFAAGRVWTKPADAPVVRAAIDLPPQMILEQNNRSLALSPDGSMMAMSATGADGRQLVWVRRLDGFAIQPLPGTEGAMQPFWSPDGRSIGFFADKKLKRVPAGGGAIQTLCDAADARGGSWGVNDVIVFAPGPFSGLSKVPASGGAAEALTRIAAPGMSHRLPWFLPDGKRVLYLSGGLNSDKEGTTAVLVLDLATGKSETVLHERSEAQFVEPGYLMFIRDGNLLAQPVDRATLKPRSAAAPIADGVMFSGLRWTGNFTLSQTGRLVFQSNQAARRSRLTWFDVDGRELGATGEPAEFVTISLSPDAKRAVTMIRSNLGAATKPEVRVYDLERGVGSRFAFGEQGNNFPVWSPDGREIAFEDPSAGVLIKAADGGSEARLVFAAKTNVWPLSWTPDGKGLLLRIQDSQAGGVDLYAFDLTPDAKPKKLVSIDPDWWLSGSLSRDGKWLLYLSNESGRRDLFVAPYPGPGEKRQVSISGAESGAWLGDHAIVYAQPPEGRLFVVDVDTTAGGLVIGAPRQIFGGKPAPRGPYAATPDGKRILFAVPVEDSASAQIRFVSDWRTELSRK
jgi:Tol biopolymer transport system component